MNWVWSERRWRSPDGGQRDLTREIFDTAGGTCLPRMTPDSSGANPLSRTRINAIDSLILSHSEEDDIISCSHGSDHLSLLHIQVV
jgi:hypothetical protein